MKRRRWLWLDGDDDGQGDVVRGFRQQRRGHSIEQDWLLLVERGQKRERCASFLPKFKQESGPERTSEKPPRRLEMTDFCQEIPENS